jgi:hypothetical protein
MHPRAAPQHRLCPTSATPLYTTPPPGIYAHATTPLGQCTPLPCLVAARQGKKYCINARQSPVPLPCPDHYVTVRSSPARPLRVEFNAAAPQSRCHATSLLPRPAYVRMLLHCCKPLIGPLPRAKHKHCGTPLPILTALCVILH